MKGFFILLLLTNALFLVWQQWFRAEPTAPLAYGGVAIINDGLPLLSELDEARRPAERTADEPAPVEPVVKVEPEVVVIAEEALPEEPVKEVEAAAGPTMFCYHSSPLDNVDAAKNLQKKLGEIGISESSRQSIEVQKTNYWVMLKPYKNSKKAKEASDILKAKGLKDYFIVRTGRSKNAISLGVYSSKERADLRYKEVIRLKARLRKPVIEALDLPAKRILVSLKLTPEAKKRLLESSIAKELQEKPCK